MNCDPIAKAYRWIEYAAFGRVLERTRKHWLPQMKGAQDVLLLGDGDGRFLSRFVAAHPAASVHYIDSSARMLAVARNRLVRMRPADLRRVTFTLSNVLDVGWEGRYYDLVVSHFFLDCFDECGLTQLAARIEPHLTRDATWVVSDFRVPGHSWMAPFFRLYLQLMFLFFRKATGLETRHLADYRAFLKGLGFERLRETTRLGDFVFSEVWRRGRESTAASLGYAAN